MIRACRFCGQRNRIPAARLHEQAKCAACHHALGPIDEPLNVGIADFDALISGARVPVLVDFWAPWCGPCRAAAPEIAGVARQMAGRAIVLKVNTDEDAELAGRYHIRSIPTFAVFRSGRLEQQQPGLVDRRRMCAWLEPTPYEPAVPS